MSSASVIVPTVEGAGRLPRLLESLAAQTASHEAIVVDNGSAGAAASRVCEGHPQVEVIRLQRNVGFSRAVNLAAERAAGEVLVLLNDDSVCDPEFVEAISGAIDPGRDVVMAAGVMRDGREPSLIDTAGMELDRTLLVFDYLNGEHVSRLDSGVADPVGPSGAAAAFDRATFVGAGGFDECLFAYWEDVDLVLRLVREGGRCALAPNARGTHEHSATLGSGSVRKNYLTGFGRGYVLRKWRVLRSPRQVAATVARDGVLCLGQLAFDRNLGGVRGRVRGYRAARPAQAYPAAAVSPAAPGPTATLRRRASRRSRLRRSQPGP